jgi:hypothetical protein
MFFGDLLSEMTEADSLYPAADANIGSDLGHHLFPLFNSQQKIIFSGSPDLPQLKQDQFLTDSPLKNRLKTVPIVSNFSIDIFLVNIA